MESRSAPAISVRPARPGDAIALAPCLRREDLDEIAAATGESPLEVLQRGVAGSTRCYAIADAADRAIAMFGVVPELDTHDGIAWLLASDRLLEHSRVFLRLSRAWADELQCGYRVLWNWVDARNTVHIRWLEWCGFIPRAESREWGIEGRLFLRYERTTQSPVK